MRPSAPVSHGGACRRSSAAGADHLASRRLRDNRRRRRIGRGFGRTGRGRWRSGQNRSRRASRCSAPRRENQVRTESSASFTWRHLVRSRLRPTVIRQPGALPSKPTNCSRINSSAISPACKQAAAFCWFPVWAAHSDGAPRRARNCASPAAVLRWQRRCGRNGPTLCAKAIDLPRDRSARELARPAVCRTRGRGRPYRGWISRRPADHLPDRSRRHRSDRRFS